MPEIPVWVLADDYDFLPPYRVGQQVDLALMIDGEATVADGPETIDVLADDQMAVTAQVLGTVYEPNNPERAGKLMMARGLCCAFPDWRLPEDWQGQPRLAALYGLPVRR